jgi:5-methylcytosine-specific restriction endonuclease McrA
MGHALVLNASFEPLQIVTWQRALQLLFQGKVEVVEESDREVRTVRFTIRVPAVLRLLQYVPLKRKKHIIRFSRANVFSRDMNTCQYCGGRFPRNQLTLDHLIPIVQGGGKTWENIVTACKPCNQRKGGRTPEEAAMQLIRKPRRPNWLPNATVQVGASLTQDSWKLYLKIESGEDELDPEQDDL